MLTEQFVAAISASTKPNTGVTKDAGIFVHEFQPLVAQRHVFKKSAAKANGVAVSASHIFAAQADKAIVHVYNREKGNQEAVVPFPERIHSIALTAEDTVLLLGTESGRVLAWEICSGRLVSTSTAHLNPVTCLAVDLSGNFFLSGSSDAMIRVWALPSVLSFSPDTSRTPVNTLSTHRGPISSLVCGHSLSSANIAVSISEDKSAIVWDYHNGQALRTYLLPETPTAVVLDPADRAFYVAYEDGSIQTVDFFDQVQNVTSIDVLRDPSSSHRPVQPLPKMRFDAESQKLGKALSLGLSWDGTMLISGHESGKIATWDVAKSAYLSTVVNLPGPVSNLQFLSPMGFPGTPNPTFKIHTVTKPKQDAVVASAGSSLVPPKYALNMQFIGRLPSARISATEGGPVAKSAFEEALTYPGFPPSMLEESLAELDTWSGPARNSLATDADVAVLHQSDNLYASSPSNNRAEFDELKKQLASLQRVQKVTFSQLSELREEKEFFLNREKKRAERAKTRAKNKQGPTNGTGSNVANEDVQMIDSDDDLAGAE